VAVVTSPPAWAAAGRRAPASCQGLHPFASSADRHRSFIEVHLAKTRRTAAARRADVPHVFTTSYLTHAPIERAPAPSTPTLGPAPSALPGRSIGLRLVPNRARPAFRVAGDRPAALDEQKEKVRESVRAALTGWARAAGEAADYTDNLPGQCLHPVGHWFEVPNLLKNGTLARLLAAQPQLRTLLVHNIDTLGATPDPALLGWFRSSGATLGWEVIARRIEDHGGGLARVDGRVRLVEGLALPQEEDEFKLTYYNTNTCWIDIDRLLPCSA
jgi:hypothetical protein